jgi:hypothetical protein
MLEVQSNASARVKRSKVKINVAILKENFPLLYYGLIVGVVQESMWRFIKSMAVEYRNFPYINWYASVRLCNESKEATAFVSDA